MTLRVGASPGTPSKKSSVVRRRVFEGCQGWSEDHFCVSGFLGSSRQRVEFSG